MATVKKQKGILLLDREKLDCYIALSQGILSLPFPQSAMKNMDVVDKNALAAVLHSFIETNKLLPTAFTLILHDRVIFEKLFPSLQKKSHPQPPTATAKSVGTPQTGIPSPAKVQPSGTEAAVPQPVSLVPQQLPVTAVTRESEALLVEQQEKEIQQFLDSVPFEETLDKRLKIPEGTLVVAANKNSIMTIKDIFTQEGFSIESILPWPAIPKDITLANGFTQEVALGLLTKVDSLKSQSFPLVDEEQPAQAGPVSLGMPQKESEKNRLYIMVGVFGVLIVVMMVLFIRMNAENAEIANKSAAPAVAPEAIPVVNEEPTPAPVASTAAFVKQALPIQIQANPQNASVSARILTVLEQRGYGSVTRRVQNTTTSQSRILFPNTTPEDVKSEIGTIVSEVVPDIAVQSSPPGEGQIQITL